MSTEQFHEGDRVKVEFTGTIKQLNSHDECATVQPDGTRYRHYIYLPNPEVTKLGPKGWPPQVGDIWEAENSEWFVSSHSTALGADSGMVLTKDSDRCWLGVESFKTRNPRLIRRRGNE